MAGSPERPTNQPLSRIEGNRNIGNHYLSKLIKNHRPEERVDWDSFERFHFQINAMTKAKIPPLLVDQLGLLDMEWNIIINQSPSILYIGRYSDTQDESWLKTDISQANATIEIAQRSEMLKLPQYLKPRDRFTPFYVRIASIAGDGVIAVTYDLENENRISELNVSIPDSESSELTEDLVELIPADVTEPYKTAGLITPAMYKKLNDLLSGRYIDDVSTQSSHNRVLIFKFGENNPTLEKFGYFEKRKARVVTVGLREEVAQEKRLHPWEISVPEFLPKA